MKRKQSTHHFIFFSLYKDKLKENENLRKLNNAAIAILIIDVLLSLSLEIYPHIDFIETKPLLKSILAALNEPFGTFIRHFWIEIISGIILYILLEERLSDVPHYAGPRDHKKLLRHIANTTTTKIRIIDTSIYSLMDALGGFKNEWKSYLQDKQNLTIQILLLHPDTYAAEQRGKDLSSKTRDYLIDMKLGLWKLYNFIEQIKAAIDESDDPQKEVNFCVKLFNTSPMMIYTSWGANLNFGLIHPNEMADDKGTFNMRTGGALPNKFEEYFEDLWSKSPSKVVDLHEYLFLGISAEHASQKLSIDLYWGGNDESRELPRYFTELDNDRNRDTLADLAFIIVKIYHDHTILLAQIKPINEVAERHKYYYAMLQIKKTYDVNMPDFGNRIYQINYFYENQIVFSGPNLIKEKLDENGYVFVPQKYYEVNRFLLERYDALNKCYNTELHEDINDKQCIDWIKAIDRTYEANPRKRLLAVYQCDMKNGVIKTTLTSDNNYPYPFIFKYNEKEIFIVPERKYPTLFELKQSKQGKSTEVDEYLHKVESLIESIIAADLVNIIGQANYINHTGEYNVYVNLIRAPVSQMHPAAYPTLQTERKTYCDYRVIHLIKRDSVVGGVNHIVVKDKNDKEKKTDSVMLEKPMDSVFFKKEIVRNKQTLKIEHNADDIHFSPEFDGEKKTTDGSRDILVVEFAKKH